MNICEENESSWYKIPDFTGNWFIDANIYGFYRLFKTYLPECIKEKEDGYYIKMDEDNVIDKYTFLRIFSHQIKIKILKYLKLKIENKNEEINNKLKEYIEKSKNKKETIKKIYKIKENEIKEILVDNEEENKIKFSKKYEEKNFKIATLDFLEEINKNEKKELIKFFINKSKKQNEKVIYFTKEEIKKYFHEKVNLLNNFISFYKNSFFINKGNKKGTHEMIEEIYSDFRNNKLEHVQEIIFNKIGNKFIYSNKEFPLENFAKTKINLKGIKIYNITNLDFALENGRFFYSPNMKFCFRINEKLRDNEEMDLIGSVIDTISELKTISWFSLNQMYIIKEKYNANNQNLFDVHYIGFPRLESSLLIDEKIAKALNKNIIIRTKKGKSKWYNLLELFVSRKSLTRIVLKSLRSNLVIENKGIYSSIIWIALDNVKFITNKEKKNPYEQGDYKIIFKTRENYLKEVGKLIKYKKIFENIKREDKLDKIMFSILQSLINNDKEGYLYKLTKIMNKVDEDKYDNLNFVKFIKDIVNNDFWIGYGSIPMICYYGGGKDV